MSLRRVQGGLAVCALVAAVIGTVALVAPAASRATGGSVAASSSSPSASPSRAGAPAVALPVGLRVAVEGGDPFVAYGLADRLTGAGVALGAVTPAVSREALAPSTTIVYYDTESMAAAGRIRAMLGTGTLRRQRVFQPPVDVTIVLGKDLSRL